MTVKMLIENLRWHAYWCDRTVNGCTARQTLRDAADALEKLDRHGRWESANDGTHFCSHCGCDAPYAWDDIDRFFINSADDVPDRISNYCPNCGARMDGET